MVSDPTDIAARKAAARKAAFAARRQAHDLLGASGEAALAARDRFLGLLDARGVAPGTPVSGFLPIRTEIDTVPLMTALHDRGHPIGVPVIQGRGKPLRFRAWTPDVAMVEGPFGAMVPVAGDWVVPQVLITPLVAFDRAGYRVGYGGGFYDRTLAELSATGTPLAIGFAYAAQELPEIPREPTDKRIDAIVTEAEVIAPGGDA